METKTRKLLWKGLLVLAAVIIGFWIQVQAGAVFASGSQPQAPATSTPQPTKRLFLPSLYRFSGLPIKLLNIEMMDSGGTLRSAYLANEPLAFSGKGINQTSAPANSLVTWSIEGPCGASTIFSGTVTLAKDLWSHLQPSISPDCLGVYTYTLQVTYQKQVSRLQSQFVINPPTQVQVTDKPAFDKCYLPPVDKMQLWWDKSPYYGVNIYLGGISQACSSRNIDAVWANQVSQQGWEFILTWVGPQAPCSKFLYKMNWDPTIAYQQGRSEADAAAAAAARIGLLGDRVIFYDLESYSNASSACRLVSMSFLKGWSTRLHELGVKSGAYGTGCTSYAADWAAIDPKPDNVWLAAWKTPYYYNPDATVWNVSCVANTEWANHERLRQYAGDHVEGWGGYAMTIDSNATDGEITILPTTTVTTSALSIPAPTSQSQPQLRDLQLVSAGNGWVLQGDDLLWSADDGASWKAITPPLRTGASILTAWFLDPQQGWSVLQDADETLSIVETADGGGSWKVTGQVNITGGFSAPARSASLQFLDDQMGWLAVTLQSGSSFSLGELFRTADGGATWQHLALPVGGRIAFSDGLHGTLTGGIDGGQRFTTVDGGVTWSQENVSTESPLIPVVPAVNLQSTPDFPSPSFAEAKLPDDAQVASFANVASGWIVVQQGTCSGNKGQPGFACQVEPALQKTTNGGDAWATITSRDITQSTIR